MLIRLEIGEFQRTVRRLPRNPLPGLLLCVLPSLLLTSGCDRSQDLAGPSATRTGETVLADSPAGRLLLESAAAYRRLASYQDAGRVVLAYQFDGQAVADVAPLSVALERPSRIGIRAYLVTAGIDQDRWRMRIGSEHESPLPRQVLSRGLPDRLDLPWIMSDPVVAEYLSAGLAGLPPQLELLFGEQPFRHLIEASTQLSIEGQGSIGGDSCQIVRVRHGELATRFWIHAQDRLLRRIELPTAALPPQMLSDPRVRDIRLTIELGAVETRTAIDWDAWRVAPQPRDLLVRRFVLPPLTSSDSRLGKTVPAFRLGGATTTHDTSRLAEAGKVQVLIWAADHPSCRSTIEQVAQALDNLPRDLADQIQPAVVWAESSLPAGMTLADLPRAWNFKFPLVNDNGVIGRDLFGIEEAPSVVVLDSQHRLQYFQQRALSALPETLAQLLPRLARGENPAAAGNPQQLAQHRFDAELWLARARDAQSDHFSPPLAYPTQLLRMHELSHSDTAPAILALAADAQQSVWLLKQDGALEQLDATGKRQQLVQTRWQFTGASPVRIQVSADQRHVAACQHGSDALQVLDTTSKHSSTVALGSGQSILDFSWTSATSTDTAQLALITAHGRTVLIDPTQSQQLSGRSSIPPLAILPTQPGQPQVGPRGAGMVVLADGRLEPLVVADPDAELPRITVKPASAATPEKPPGDKNLAEASAAELLTREQLASEGASAHSRPAAAQASLSRLLFRPAAGPWWGWSDDQGPAVLARGWIAADEPGLFLLDAQLRQRWHAPVPIASEPTWPLASVARDPVSGQPLWVVVQPKNTLHFLRADGLLTDHCQFAEAVNGVALLPVGNQLQLLVAHPDRLVRYQLSASE
jgi:hypothetical protein